MVEEKPNSAAKLRFDTSINLGHILTMLTIGGAIALAYTAYRVEVTELSTRVTILENVSKTQEATTIAVHSIRSDIAIMRDRLERFESERQEREQEERQRRREWERQQPGTAR
jgi:NAD/NADP transhydrogenase beta subunit